MEGWLTLAFRYGTCTTISFSTMTHETLIEAGKAAPPITVGGLSLAGVALSDWLIILTLVYTVLQIIFLIRDKWYLPRKKNGSKR
jgi:hypothetical protein